MNFKIRFSIENERPPLLGYCLDTQCTPNQLYLLFTLILDLFKLSSIILYKLTKNKNTNKLESDLKIYINEEH